MTIGTWITSASPIRFDPAPRNGSKATKFPGHTAQPVDGTIQACPDAHRTLPWGRADLFFAEQSGPFCLMFIHAAQKGCIEWCQRDKAIIGRLAQTANRRMADVIGPSDVAQHLSRLSADDRFSFLMAGQLGFPTEYYSPRLC